MVANLVAVMDASRVDLLVALLEPLTVEKMVESKGTWRVASRERYSAVWMVVWWVKQMVE